MFSYDMIPLLGRQPIKFMAVIWDPPGTSASPASSVCPDSHSCASQSKSSYKVFLSVLLVISDDLTAWVGIQCIIMAIAEDHVQCINGLKTNLRYIRDG